MRETICFGELLIDFVPTVNGVSLAEAPAFKKAPGGAPANVAAGMARLGDRVAFMGKVGDDEFGHMLAGVLADNGVAVDTLRFDTTARTALAFVTLRADGEREFMFYRHPSADMLLRPDEIDGARIAQAGLFHFGSISLIAEPCRSAHLHALDLAEQAGCLLSYDPNLRLPLWPDADAARVGIRSVWQRADVIKINEDELAFLNAAPVALDDAAALHAAVERLWSERLKLLLVTAGGKGSHYFTPTMRGSVSGFRVAAIDTTGAGDAFTAGFLHRLVNDPDLLHDERRLRAALRFANAAGALTTTQRGAIPALPTAAAIGDLLAAQPG